MIEKTEAADMLEACAHVIRERGQDYGRPGDNFQRIADLWSVYLGMPVSLQDVGILMALVKVARLMATPGHEDSLVDLAGYAAATYEAVGSEKSGD